MFADYVKPQLPRPKTPAARQDDGSEILPDLTPF